MKRVYMCCQPPCSSTEHIIIWLNQLGLDGWLMCGRHASTYESGSRRSNPPSFYFTGEERRKD